jgi:hypothetical protein
MRVSKTSLQTDVKWLNALLERPMTLMNDNDETNVGHLCLDKDAGGYRLDEITDGRASIRSWSARMNGADMALFISGIKNGISLRNAQLTEKVLRTSLDKVGLTIAGQELYNN